MRFVHVEDYMPPDAGYQINLLTKLQVQQGHDVFVVTGEPDKVPSSFTNFFGKENIEKKDLLFLERTGVKIIRIPLKGFYSGRAIFYKKKLFKTVQDLNPDVVFVHGEDTLTGIQFIWNYSKLNYPIILDCHMLEMASKNRLKRLFRLFYRTFITPKVLKYNIPLIRVVDSNFVEKCLGIPLKNTILLSFGTDTSFFTLDLTRNISLRQQYGIKPDDFVIIYAGKLDKYKGGLFFAEAIKEKLITSKGKEVVFVIIGNTDGQYGTEVETLFAQSESRIIRLPTQSYHDLAKFYQMADLSVFPKQCSLSFFEVQSCGIPVVFEENEINSQRAMYKNGFTFIPDDMRDFRAKLLYCIDMEKDEYDKMRSNARKYIQDNFDYLPIAQKFTDVMIDEYKRFHNK